MNKDNTINNNLKDKHSLHTDDIKVIMDTTTKTLIERMEKLKFRKKIFKASRLFNSKEIAQVMIDWDTLSYKSKVDWFETILFHTKDENGKENPQAYDEIMLISGLLTKNKANLAATWRDLKAYGDLKKLGDKDK